MMTPIRMPATKPHCDDDRDDRQQRQVFGDREAPARLDDPFVQLIGAEIDQEPAEHEFRHVAEQIRRDRQHQRADRRDGEAGQPSAAAGVEIEDRPADRDAAGITGEAADYDIGEAGDVQLAFQIGLAMHCNLDPGGVEQRARRGDEDDRDQIADQIGDGEPGIAGQLVRVPRQHEFRQRRWPEGPPAGPGVLGREAEDPEHQMRRDHAADQR